MPTKVALDVSPLLGEPTGVGGVTRGLFDALSQRRDIELKAFAMSARGHADLDIMLPASMQRNKWPMPAGILQKLWAHHPWPPVEYWVGDVDVAHGTNFVVPPTKGSTLVTIHDLTAIRYPKMCEPHTLTYPSMIGVEIGRGAHVHTFSQFVANEVMEHYGLSKDRVHVIPAALTGVEVATKPVRTDQSYVLAIGTVEPRKNYPGLVRAFDRIADKHPDTALIIAGDRGWAFDGLQHVIRHSKHRKQIQYVGRVSTAERDKLLSKAAVLAYPSIYEGFGLPPLEAMRAGIPVVASNSGALPEVLGDAALLVDPNDEVALAEALHSVLSDDRVRARLVADGALRAQMYDWRRSADKFVSLYQELLS